MSDSIVILMQTGATALYCASGNGYVRIVQLLIQAGANLDIPASAVCHLDGMTLCLKCLSHQAQVMYGHDIVCWNSHHAHTQ